MADRTITGQVSERDRLLESLLRAEPNAKLVGLLHLSALADVHGSGLRARWHRHVLANAALRDRPYMEELFSRYFPGVEMLAISDNRIPEAAIKADIVVLLFPDAIGLGFSWIERQLSRPNCTSRILALNGRGRLRVLDRQTLRRLRFRRFLERSRLPEFAFFGFFLVATPCLALADLVKGSR